MSVTSQHDRPLVIYCSACADSRQFSGDSCWHCGAASEHTFKYRGYGFVTLILVALLAGGLLLGVAANRQADASTFAMDDTATQSPDRLSPSSLE